MGTLGEGDVVGDLPKLIQSVARAVRTDAGHRVSGSERRRPVVPWILGNSRNADDIADVELGLIGAAEELMLEKAMPSGAHLVDDGGRKNVHFGKAEILAGGAVAARIE